MGGKPLCTAGKSVEQHGDPRHDEAVRTLVAAVSGRDLRAPAVFLLEVARPFRLLIQQAFIVGHPLLSPWLGDRLLSWAELLDGEEAIDRALAMMRDT